MPAALVFFVIAMTLCISYMVFIETQHVGTYTHTTLLYK